MLEEDVCQREKSDRQIAARRSRLGLMALPPEGRVALEAAVAAQTPAGMRFETLLAIGEEIDAHVVPVDDFERWATMCQRLDAVGYALRLVEAQLIAGNTGPGMLLPDKDLLV